MTPFIITTTLSSRPIFIIFGIQYRKFNNLSSSPIWAGRILDWPGTCWTSFVSELHLTGSN